MECSGIWLGLDGPGMSPLSHYMVACLSECHAGDIQTLVPQAALLAARDGVEILLGAQSQCCVPPDCWKLLKNGRKFTHLWQATKLNEWILLKLRPCADPQACR